MASTSHLTVEKVILEITPTSTNHLGRIININEDLNVKHENLFFNYCKKEHP